MSTDGSTDPEGKSEIKTQLTHLEADDQLTGTGGN